LLVSLCALWLVYFMAVLVFDGLSATSLWDGFCYDNDQSRAVVTAAVGFLGVPCAVHSLSARRRSLPIMLIAAGTFIAGLTLAFIVPGAGAESRAVPASGECASLSL
jgi:hypothetical protein